MLFTPFCYLFLLIYNKWCLYCYFSLFPLLLYFIYYFECILFCHACSFICGLSICGHQPKIFGWGPCRVRFCPCLTGYVLPSLGIGVQSYGCPGHWGVIPKSVPVSRLCPARMVPPHRDLPNWYFLFPSLLSSLVLGLSLLLHLPLCLGAWRWRCCPTGVVPVWFSFLASLPLVTPPRLPPLGIVVAVEWEIRRGLPRMCIGAIMSASGQRRHTPTRW